MIHLLYILPLAYLLLGLLFGHKFPATSTVPKGSHWPRAIDWILLKGGWFGFRQAPVHGPMGKTFIVTQAMVDALNWPLENPTHPGDPTISKCYGQASKIIGRTAGLRTPTKGSVRVVYRYHECPQYIDAATGLNLGELPGIELLAMGHDPKQNGKLIFEVLGTAKVGDRVEMKMDSYLRWNDDITDKYGVTDIHIFLNDPEYVATYNARLPIDTRRGFALGHYQGGDCPALNEVTL